MAKCTNAVLRRELVEERYTVRAPFTVTEHIFQHALVPLLRIASRCMLIITL